MPGNDGKKFVPNGVFLTCDKGAAPSVFTVTPKTVQLYGEVWANEFDMIPMVNIKTFGACACTMGNPCVPAPTMWMQVHEEQMIVSSARPLLESSFIMCGLGGKIEIHFTRAGAAATINAEAKAHEDANNAKLWSIGLFVGAVVVGAAVLVVTGGAAAPVLLAAMGTSAAIGAGIGGAAGAVEGYGHGGGISGALMGAAKGAAMGGVVGAVAPVAAAGGLVSGGLMLGSMGMMGKGMYHDYEAYDINPSQDNALTLAADAITVLGIVVVGARSRKGAKGNPKEELPPKEIPKEELPPKQIPKTPVSKPVDRHTASKVKQNTVAKDKNTVIGSKVPVADDVAAINRGEAKVGRTSGGETSYTINGRTYGAHDNGRLYPIEGNGFIELNRGEFKALGVYNELGTGPRSESILDNMGISTEGRTLAQQAHQSGKQ
jgi:hypothetical protein